MPQHPTPTRQRQAQLSEPALARQGIPANVMPGLEEPSLDQVNEILSKLRSGQVGAENMMQLLALLAAAGGQRGQPRGPQGPQGPQRPQRPQQGSQIRQALG